MWAGANSIVNKGHTIIQNYISYQLIDYWFVISIIPPNGLVLTGNNNHTDQIS